ncbi:hypothetical protein BBP40_012052 [Aspergillus hancockii]|nr:hypothetical protein BBP40_012052 [Aspergillus hancockii]
MDPENSAANVSGGAQGIQTTRDFSNNVVARATKLVPEIGTQLSTLGRHTHNPYSGLLLLYDADTLLYIDPPPQNSYMSVLPRSTGLIPHRIHSQNLLGTGSSYFKALFQPRAQARTISRRGLEGKLTNGIKYVIDLTPPSVDDDAVIFLTELSCPLGIRNWAHFFNEPWILPTARVNGEDEVELPEDKAGCASAPGANNPNLPGAPTTRGKKPGLPVEYSGFRHRDGIVDVIKVLEGYVPKLDTPCKFWTFFALARLFGVATTPKIRNLILSWLYDSGNARLIENHPEIAYKIGYGIQCDYLCRDSYSVLVGEEALLLLANSNKQPSPGRPQRTFHGRLREPLLDDDELQRIEYASKSFMEYVVDRFINLAGTEMRWLCELPTFQEIAKFIPKTQTEQSVVSALVITCKEYVRARIAQWLERGNGIWLPNTDPSRDQKFSEPAYQYIYSTMRYPERLLSRTFWQSLMSERFKSDDFPGIDKRFWVSSISSFGGDLPAFNSQIDANLSPVKVGELCKIVQQFNSLSEDTEMIEDIYGHYNHLGSDPWRREDSYNPDTWLARLYSQKQGLFALESFIEEVRSYVTRYASDMLELEGSVLMRTDTVTRLTENEFKYLPLWAGGNDDGTGGVFMDQHIPILEAGGFSTPGPHIHLGSAASTSDSISLVGTGEFESTVQGASHRPTDGYGADAVSIQSMTTSSQKDTDAASNQQEPTALECCGAAGNCSFIMDSSAEDDADDSFDCDRDSSDTVVMDTLSQADPLSDFEELDLNEAGP